MALKMTLWFCALMFVAMVYNGVSAYTAMGSTNVQEKFQKIGLISGPKHFIIPARKPVPPQNQLASVD